VLGEAMGGLRHLTGEPGRVPVRVGVSIGDTLAALHGVIGVLTALHHRTAHGGQGQFIDVALYEAVFNVMESLVPEHDAFGAVRERAGSALPGIAPTNAYLCNDGQYVLVAGNGDSIFRRLMRAIGRPDLETDPDLAHNDGRVRRVEEIDSAIEAWTRERDREAVLAVLDGAGVPVGRIYSVADIASDPQYLAREMIVDSPTSDGKPLKVPGVVPKLSATPGGIAHPAPRLGQHTVALSSKGWPARTRETSTERTA
jgi:crotonobetainyl-CoA:carnitine CoA-transferase CaiB-like acyl-CoA transferase